jgi:hypothetical protein
MSEEQKTIRRIFGRGVLAGLKMAGITNPGDVMNSAKLEEAERSLNAMATKVLNACPLQEPWKLHQIMGEMSRNGQNPDKAVVEGCMTTLKHKGLVREAPPGHYIRVSAKPRTTPAQGAQPPEEAPTREVAAVPPVLDVLPVDPLERLMALAGGMRKLSAQIAMLADEADNIVLAIEEKQQTDTAAMAKLRQFQAMIRELSA